MARYRSKRKRKEVKKSYLLVFLAAIVILLIAYLLSTRKAAVNRSERGVFTKVEVIDIQPDRTVPESIAEAVKALNIPPKAYRLWKGKDTIYYYIGIDKFSLELSYANMLFTSYIERDGGIYLEGQEVGSDYRQVITFKDLPMDKPT
jgi:hypothetical protein